MSTALIDPEGFPRSDIDVASIRTARSQINRLRNDLKEVIGNMSKLLEKGLPKTESSEEKKDVVMSNGNGTEVNGNGVNGDEDAKMEAEKNVPFAKVDGVFPNSPADVAVSSLY